MNVWQGIRCKRAYALDAEMSVGRNPLRSLVADHPTRPHAFAVHGSFRVESLPLPGPVPDAVWDEDHLGAIVVWSPIAWGHIPTGYGYVSAHRMQQTRAIRTRLQLIMSSFQIWTAVGSFVRYDCHGLCGRRIQRRAQQARLHLRSDHVRNACALCADARVPQSDLEQRQGSVLGPQGNQPKLWPRPGYDGLHGTTHAACP